MSNKNTKSPSIKIRGAKQNNLKSIDVDIPQYQLIAVTGVSGSGKSSLVNDIIANEGRRQFLASIPSFARQFAHKISSANVDDIQGLFPVITIRQHRRSGSVKSTVGTISEIYDYLRLLYARFGTTEEAIKLSRSLFSFNSPIGACAHCNGLGLEEKIDLNKLIADPQKTIAEGALAPTLPNGYIVYSQVTINALNKVCNAHGFDINIPWNKLTADQQHIVLNGSDKVKVPFGKHSIESRLKWTGIKAKPREEGHYKGMLPIMNDILKRDRNKNILKYVTAVTCSKCKGKRLNENALSVKYQQKTIDVLVEWRLDKLLAFFEKIKLNDDRKIVERVKQQLEALCQLGNSHLKLSQPAITLTAGEMQRIKLVNHLSAQLSNVLYVFDETGIGLHPRDKGQMIKMLKALVRLGNTVIIAEHDPDIIKHVDWIVEVGPAAGTDGGELLYNGPTHNFLDNKLVNGNFSPTQRAMQGINPIENLQRKDDFLILKNGHPVNEFRFKKHALNVVTGVPGGGKAELVYFNLIPQLQRVIKVDQSPIGRTPKSNPATYTGMADHIRDLFAKQELARKLGYKKGRFSFNNKGGRCTNCEGAGKIQIGMHYLGRVDIQCEYCNGKRFNDATLEVLYKEKNIAAVYDLSIKEALTFFEDEPKITKYLKTLVSLGLGYIKLGQSSTTLSGGEAQRIKLATALVKKTRKDNWFILDEPTTGLHVEDILVFLKALNLLIEEGQHIVCISQHKMLLQSADWIIELGAKNSTIQKQFVFQGTWSQLQRKSNSPTINAFNANKLQVFETKEMDQYEEPIFIKNIHSNNLKNIDITVPKNKITLIVGRSGAGKSSLAFNTIYAESQSRFKESLNVYTRGFIKSTNPAKADYFENLTPAVAVTRKNLPNSKRSTVGTITGILEKYRFIYSRIAQLEGKEFSASAFSFNHESGACSTCTGLGTQLTTSPELLVKDWNLSILDGALMFNTPLKYYGNPDGQFVAILKVVGQHFGFDLSVPMKDFSKEAMQIIFYGAGEQEWQTTWHFKNKTRTGSKEIADHWKGFCNLINEEYEAKKQNKNIEKLLELLTEIPCENCKGARLAPPQLSIEIDGFNIAKLSQLTIIESKNWFEKQIHNNKNAPIIKGFYEPLQLLFQRLISLGLGHLSIDRRSNTLSGGEGQRLYLASRLSSGLNGMTYILDEPSIGLHNKNIDKLISILKEIKARGNTIVIVEHDAQLIRTADHIIEIGPSAGKNGGAIVASGNYSEFLKSKESITVPYLKSQPVFKPILVPIQEKAFGVKGVNKFNLVNRDFDFNSGGLIAITGVSGAGKSTLMHEILSKSLSQNKPINCEMFYCHEPFDQVCVVDQRALQGSKMSTVASVVGILDLLQSIFTVLSEAKEKGLKKASFSYHHKDGRCSVCNGLGQLKLSMDFMADVWNICDACDGLRYNPTIRNIKIKGKSIADLLQFDISELYQFFENEKDKKTLKLNEKLLALKEIGLGHIQIGQQISTLSGGEAQRLKLIQKLWNVDNGKALFLLDEPSAGLHYRDIEELVLLFNKLVKAGHTIVFIEHNDYLISAAHQVVLV